MLRTIAERVARRIVIRRRLPSSFGRRPFFVTPDSALTYLKPGYGAFRDLVTIASEYVQEGDHVWDIGGNLGAFSFLASHRVGEAGTVVCVEPDPILASLIQRSTQLAENRDRTTHVLCSAVTNTSEITQFSIAVRGRSSNSLQHTTGRSQAGGTRYTQLVPTTTLDSMLAVFPPPTIIKIDVEGAEQLVLEGGHNVLKEHRPKFYLEVGKQPTASVTEILRSYGYQLFDGTQPKAQRQLRSACVFNTLAIPSEQIRPRLYHAA
ncbi:MAG: FkbM family methyltransferase [Fuerstiella sp.]|nr:FkbM family methyltransferase [Fuerstiella sp.]